MRLVCYRGFRAWLFAGSLWALAIAYHLYSRRWQSNNSGSRFQSELLKQINYSSNFVNRGNLDLDGSLLEVDPLTAYKDEIKLRLERLIQYNEDQLMAGVALA